MHQHLMSPSEESLSHVATVMCLFWELEAGSCALYEKMVVWETDPRRTAGWQRLLDVHLILVRNRPANHNVYVSRRLLGACRESIRQDELLPRMDADPFVFMGRIMHVKFLQVMLIASLRQQASIASMIDINNFDKSVALVTRLVLASRGC